MYTVHFDTIQGLGLSGLCLAAQRDGFSYMRWTESRGGFSSGGFCTVSAKERKNLLNRGDQIVLCSGCGRVGAWQEGHAQKSNQGVVEVCNVR